MIRYKARFRDAVSAHHNGDLVSIDDYNKLKQKYRSFVAAHDEWIEKYTLLVEQNIKLKEDRNAK
jgi:hypothetical protein